MKSLKGIGKINIESTVKDGEGIRITKDFLEKLTIQFAKQSSKYIDGTAEAPFSYGEKQIHSIIGPSIANLTPLLMMESPIERKWNKKKENNTKDYTGFLDYWCRYRNTDFFIELKLDKDSYKSSIIRKDLLSNWKYMIYNQLNPIKEEAKRFSVWSKGVIMIGIHIVPIYDRGKESSIGESWSELVDRQKDYFELLKPRPNWSSIWMLSKQLVKDSKEDYRKSSKTFYPAVMMICKISRIIN